MQTLRLGEVHFGRAQLGDRRRTRRLVQCADRILQHPSGSLPDKFGQPAPLKGLYRLVASPQVTHDKILESHFACVQERIAAADGDVLVIHDTTELDYSGLDSLADDLGTLGGKGAHRGFQCHNSLAVAVESRAVLGLTSQILHCRQNTPKNESRQAGLEKPQRESRLWQRGCAQSPGPTTERRVIDVCDRGSDLFEFLESEQKAERLYLVRSTHNRECKAEGPHGRITARLHDYARGLAAQGHFEVTVAARDRRPARRARVQIAAAPVWIAAPRQPRGQHGSDPLAAWVVCVREVEPPVEELSAQATAREKTSAKEPLSDDASSRMISAKATPVEWILLTNVEVTTLGHARERTNWYSLRWLVEELHKAQKTGCSIEQQQFTVKSRLESVIAMLSVVAVELLRMRNAARHPDCQKEEALAFFPPLYVQVLSAWRHGCIRALTAGEFYVALARLGGHQNRKHDHPPGWIVLWRGWTKLESMVAGARALEAARSGQT